MNKFQPHIIPVYPPNNELIFEEWFRENYKGCNTDRELLPIFPTSFHVNNGYGEKKQELQDYCDTLPTDKKYFGICQYDDGFMIEWDSKDVLEFNMSKRVGVQLPLLSKSQPYKFNTSKKWFASFAGGKTHPVREKIQYLKDINGYYFSFENHFIQDYCRILNESMFALCPRGYGVNSFRIAEAVQYGAIPVYISDEFILPLWMNFEEFGVLIKSEDILRIDEILSMIEPEEIVKKQNKLPEAYENFYTYEANLKHIIKYLETEYNLRQSG